MTDTLLYWGYGVEVKVLMDRKDYEKVPNEVEIKEGKDLVLGSIPLHGNLKGRKPKYN